MDARIGGVTQDRQPRTPEGLCSKIGMPQSKRFSSWHQGDARGGKRALGSASERHNFQLCLLRPSAKTNFYIQIRIDPGLIGCLLVAFVLGD